MNSRFPSKTLAVAVATALVFGGLLYFGTHREKLSPPPPVETVHSVQTSVIGTSVEGRPISAYAYGTGPEKLVFVGGLHGGYEWNSVLLAYQFMDYLEAHPESIPPNETVVVIPSANPDGVFKVIGKEGKFTLADAPLKEDATGKGRFNAHDVDLNRNFDCNWKAKSTWRNKPVSGGTAPFSEPESIALRDYFLEAKPQAAVFWHSQANTVYSSSCGASASATTLALMKIYAAASGYLSATTFDAYAVTGDATDWLASINIPAITVELSTHTAIEWGKNFAGIQALIEYYKK